MKGNLWIKRVAVLAGLAIAALAIVLLLRSTSLGDVATWQQQASPGRLSAAHAFLESNCAACHTPVAGVEAANCIACHASNEWLLQRQPTAFHASIGSCRECHPEHQGGWRPPSTMDHATLAAIGMRQTGGKDARPETVLDCAACHGTKDRHFGLFGQDCVQCHTTTRWTIPEFRHPSARSTDCAQCHQAPPSHYMGHFHMVSARVAGKPHARVEQCYLCHQTTAWNDIKGVGFYKHH
jgi:hypothetical protein